MQRQGRKHTHVHAQCHPNRSQGLRREHAVAGTPAAEGQVAAAPGLTIDALTFDKGGK